MPIHTTSRAGLSYGSTSEEADKALHHFREAIRIDPQFALAYAAIANEKIIQALFSTATRSEIFDEARTAVQSAMALNPNLADAWLVDGAIKFYGDWDWTGAEAVYKKAIELDPDNATTYIRYSAALAALGRFDESLALADKAIELDPISISSLHNLGWVNLVARNFEVSESAFEKALELYPTWGWGHLKKGYAHMFQGEYEAALQHSERAAALLEDGWGSELIQTAFMEIYTYCGQKEKSAATARHFFAHIEENGCEDPFTMSSIYTSLGDYNKAFEWGARVIAERSPSAYLYNIDIFFPKEFMADPRFRGLLSAMGFKKPNTGSKIPV